MKVSPVAPQNEKPRTATVYKSTFTLLCVVGVL